MKTKRVRIRKAKKKHSVRDLSLGEVSFVDKGDNPGAYVLLMKRKEENTVEEVLKSSPNILQSWVKKVKYDVTKKNAPAILSIISKETEAKTFTEIKNDRAVRDDVYNKIWTLEESLFSILNDDDVEDKNGMIQETVAQFQQAITTIIKSKGGSKMNRLEKLLAQLKKDNPDMEDAELMEKAATALATTADTLEKEKTDLDTEKGDLTKQVETLTTDLEKAKEGEGGEVKIDKSKLAPDVREHMEKMEKESEENKKAIEKLKKDGQKADFIKRAEVLKACGDTDEIAGLLIKVDDLDSEVAGEVEKILANNAAIIKASPLFKETGHNSENDNGSALDLLNKKAEELRKTEAGANLSLPQAFTKVMKDPANADLKKQYNDER